MSFIEVNISSIGNYRLISFKFDTISWRSVGRRIQKEIQKIILFGNTALDM